MENVKNLAGHDKGKTFSIIKDALKQAGYHVKYKVMKTSEFSEMGNKRKGEFSRGSKNFSSGSFSGSKNVFGKSKKSKFG